MDFNVIFNLVVDNWITTALTVVSSIASVIAAIYVVRLFRMREPVCWAERAHTYDENTKYYLNIRHGLPRAILLKGPAYNGKLEGNGQSRLEPGKIMSVKVNVPSSKKRQVNFTVKHNRKDEYWLHVNW